MDQVKSPKRRGPKGKVAPKAPSPKAAAAKASRTQPKPSKVKRRDAAGVIEIFTRFQTANPEPKGELEHVNAYTLLVAVVLSAQATDAGVNKATRALFALADTPEKMLALGEDAVREHVRTIGLFRTKAKNVIALSEILVRDHASIVPADRAALETLPGVGRKTANVVLNMAFGQITHAVDTHVFRVANRLAIAPGKNVLTVELGLEKAVPAAFGHHAHHWLILHGRYTCKARNPDCAACIVADLCSSADKRSI
jgi:endonuclease III